mgnify:CR=1 FL=1
MNQDDKKRAAAKAALEYIEHDAIIGIGTGSTANYFIDMLGDLKHKVDGAVASSEASAERLKSHGIPVVDLNGAGDLSVYVDGADEATHHRHLIKGGGGALTREKIVAAASKTFVCIVDDTKLVERLGKFPLPIEVIPMARSFVSRRMVIAGGTPEYRHGFVTDNGNDIIDISGLRITEPVKLESEINQIVGVVTNGLFAARGADVLIVGGDSGVKIID